MYLRNPLAFMRKPLTTAAESSLELGISIRHDRPGEIVGKFSLRHMHNLARF